LRDAEVAAHAKLQFHCSKCRQTTVVEIEMRPDRTMVISLRPSFARSNASRSNLTLVVEHYGLKLPAAKTAILRVASDSRKKKCDAYGFPFGGRLSFGGGGGC
jgi:hypothetical protein